MLATAAIVDSAGNRFRMAPVTVAPPAADEVQVRIVAVGICHTDLMVRAGGIPGLPMPAILGHEGAGVVEEAGAEVRDLSVGDHVVLSFAFCGSCRHCQANKPSDCDRFFPANFLDDSGAVGFAGESGNLHAGFFGQSSFATYANVKSRHAVRVAPDLPLELLAPLGCGVLTGAGTVINNFRAQPGASIAVFGAGAVGLSAIMAAAAEGCGTIVAIDKNEARLEFARSVGATHLINSSDGNVAQAVRAVLPRGADYVLDTTGAPEIVTAALKSVERRGAVVLVAGNPAKEIALDMGALLSGATIRMLAEGGSVPRETIPWLIAKHKAGKFPFDRMISIYPFEQINEAAEDAASGRVIKPVLLMPNADLREVSR